MSAQRLAGRCSELGLPAITRQVVTHLETGRRESVTVAELAVLAAALELAPVELLLPFGAAETEYLPGRTAPPQDVARWWAGEAGFGEDGAVSGEWRRGAATLFGDHDRTVAELNQALADRDAPVSEAEYHRMRRQPSEPGGLKIEDRLVVVGIAGLREMREGIRALGLEPPGLPDELKWVDKE
jgi:hypothetical protein